MAILERVTTRFRLTRWQQVAFTLALLVVIDLTGLSQVITGAINWSLLPVKQFWVGGINQVYVVWQNAAKLPKSAVRIQELEQRLAEASASLAELETLRRENDELDFLLTNTDRPSARTVIVAPIIAFAQPAIAAGSQAGIKVGAIVLSRNTLLGQVTKVGSYESQVTLLLEANSQPVLAQTDAGVKGLIVGDGRKVLFTQVPKESVINVGDRIITLGQPQIEQNLPIGRIVKVINEPAASVQSAIVEQYASFFAAPVVEVR